MDRTYIDEVKGQAICCWDAPDQKSVENLFTQAHVKTESIKQVVEYPGQFFDLLDQVFFRLIE